MSIYYLINDKSQQNLCWECFASILLLVSKFSSIVAKVKKSLIEGDSKHGNVLFHVFIYVFSFWGRGMSEVMTNAVQEPEPFYNYNLLQISNT